MNIIAATGKEQINLALDMVKGCKVIGTVESRKELMNICNVYYDADILFVTEALSGSQQLTEILFQITRTHSNLRIIYITGPIDMRSEARVNSLGYLVMSGMYDIITDKKLNMDMITNIINNPKTYDDVSYLTKNIKTETYVDDDIEFDAPVDEEETEDLYKKVFTFSSIKPGTGKSFISTNIATGIAAFGKPRPDGKKPKVALIEGDLQNLSIGTLLQIEDDKRNLKTSMNVIKKIISPDGELIGNAEEIEMANRVIKGCFKPYYNTKNLEALTGSQLTYDEVQDVKPFYYMYLVDAIIDDYDVIIIDSNSSISHVTTYPLLKMASSCYYILNLDFNNIRNNTRYKKTLKELGISEKVKYILNQDIKNDADGINSGTNVETLLFTANQLNDSGFKLEAKIPAIPQTVFLNRLYEGKPIILDNKEYTKKVRFELLKYGQYKVSIM